MDPVRDNTPPRAGAPANPPRVDPVDAFIAQQTPEVRGLLDLCREFLHSTAPGLREGIKWGIPTFMMERNLFYLNPQRDHVVLGFDRGAKMPEFRGVFDKVATEVAHVIVRGPDDLTRPGLRAAVRSEAGLPQLEPVVAFRERSDVQGAGDRVGTMRSLPPK